MSRRERLRQAEFMRDEVGVYCPERLDECQKLVDEILAEPTPPSLPARVSSLSEARASLTAAHVRTGIDSPFTRALETSERRAAYAKRDQEWLARVSLQMAANARAVREDPRAFVRSLRKC